MLGKTVESCTGSVGEQEEEGAVGAGSGADVAGSVLGLVPK